MSNRQYSQEFKDNACRLILEEGHKIPQLARDLGMNENNLYRWVGQAKRAAEQVDGQEAANLKRMKQLEAENKRLRLESEILKKAMAYFVDQPK